MHFLFLRFIYYKFFCGFLMHLEFKLWSGKGLPVHVMLPVYMLRSIELMIGIVGRIT